jgi:hypothetical protein
MPIEFMFGRQLSPEELELIREQIESMDEITAIDDEVHGIVERKRSASRCGDRTDCIFGLSVGFIPWPII